MGDVFPRIRVAAVQAASAFLDRDASVAKACRLIREAGAGGADLIGLPEGFIPAHPVWTHFHACSSRQSMIWNRELFQNAVEVPSAATAALGSAARDARAFAVVGVCEKEPGRIGTMYNSQLFFDPSGRLLGRHRKLVPTQGERMVHTGGRGDSLHVFEAAFVSEASSGSGGARVSGLICGENSNPLAVYTLIARGANLHVASWPPHFNPGPDMAEIVLIASRALAYQAKAFVINAVGEVSEEMLRALPATDADRAFLERAHQGSSIVGPTGRLIAGPMGRGEGILYADADLGEIVGPKIVQDFAGHYNRQDIFRLTVGGRVPRPGVDAVEGGAGECADPVAAAAAGERRIARRPGLRRR